MGAVLKLLINMMKLKCHSPTPEGRIGFLALCCITFTEPVPEHVLLVGFSQHGGTGSRAHRSQHAENGKIRRC